MIETNNQFGQSSMEETVEQAYIGYYQVLFNSFFYIHNETNMFFWLYLQVKLDYPHEVLTCISGYYGYVGKGERQQVIKSLTFYTSRGKFGPFGEEIGHFFTSTTTEGKVVGFHGRSSLYLDAIGVHMQHWLGGQRASKSSMFKLF